MNPVFGYLFSALAAGALYVIGMLVTLWFLAQPGGSAGVPLDAAAFVAMSLSSVVFLPALGLMILPWLGAVCAHRRLGFPGAAYYASVGASATLVIGCATASLSPKPLFVEDQSFLEGAMIAAERQGAALIVAGVAFGLTYWRLSVRGQPGSAARPGP